MTEQEYQKRREEALQRLGEGREYPWDWKYIKNEHMPEDIAHPDTMRKEPATILLIVGMIGSLIFKQWYFAWMALLWWYFSKHRV